MNTTPENIDAKSNTHRNAEDLARLAEHLHQKGNRSDPYSR